MRCRPRPGPLPAAEPKSRHVNDSPIPGSPQRESLASLRMRLLTFCGLSPRTLRLRTPWSISFAPLRAPTPLDSTSGHGSCGGNAENLHVGCEPIFFHDFLIVSLSRSASGSKTASDVVAFLVVWHEGCLIHYDRCSDHPSGLSITRGPPTTHEVIRLDVSGGNPQWRTRQTYR
jgi:hypothetical protein